MFSTGKNSASLKDILSKVSEGDILSHYLGVTSVPTVINSPIRKDSKPSFGINSPDGNKIYWIDLSTKDKGGLFDLLALMWNTDFNGVLRQINKDLPNIHSSITYRGYSKCNVNSYHSYSSNSDLKCKTREWRHYDIAYWESYGITLPWLKYAEVYPVSHKIVEKDGHQYVFGADKYAYAYVEHKEGKVTLKIYQPFNTYGYKWSNKHDSSVISLWTKVPKTGDKICICSSLKDALCLWCNTGIPCIAPQGEGYKLSDTAVSELKKRYKQVYILFDNDEAGIMDAQTLAESTGFTNLVLPQGYGKDVSDIYHNLKDKRKFLEIISNLFN